MSRLVADPCWPPPPLGELDLAQSSNGAAPASAVHVGEHVQSSVDGVAVMRPANRIGDREGLFDHGLSSLPVFLQRSLDSARRAIEAFGNCRYGALAVLPQRDQKLRQSCETQGAELILGWTATHSPNVDR